MKISLKIYKWILNLRVVTILLILSQIGLGQNANQPGRPEEPVRVINDGINMEVHDGSPQPGIGTENIQVLRPNRTHPETADNFSWTYDHAPMLAYWKGKFYLEYLSNPFGEHIAPGQTLVATSRHGKKWNMPKQVFPIYLLRPGPISSNETGMAMMHQRMGFYVAPNGRFQPFVLPEKMFLSPIPQSEIDKDSKLEQSLGYYKLRSKIQSI